ncbi:MAG: thiamine phosphate synthase [Phycisphaerae bacterium]|nr:thiamine phosphate synthase [Phycisphaerae bacterium]
MPRVPDAAILRMLDANTNRAREGLRVLEDIARFALDHDALAREAKTLRHALTDAIASIPGAQRLGLLGSRDTPGDVGTVAHTPAERAGLPSLAASAGARTTEALRVIEESSKSLGGSAEPIERLRYRAYTLDRDLGLALGRRDAPQWRLCVLLTASLCTHVPWDGVAARAIEGGADCLQLREKSLEAGELLTRARVLVALARRGPRAVHVVINDRPDVALLAEADGVHLGQSDLPIADTRRLAGHRLWIGVSTSSIEQARDAVRSGADYCGIGPMFPTTTKHKDRIVGPDYLAEYLRDPILAACPHLAIGGINVGNVASLRGVRGVAVSSTVCNSPDPAAACREILVHMPG